MVIFDSYKDSKKYTAPNKNIDPEKKKDKDYFLSHVEYIYSLQVQNKLAITCDNWDAFSVQRAYGRGEQDPQLYVDARQRDILSNINGQSGNSQVNTSGSWNREGLSNINYQIMSPMPKVKRAIYGKIADFDFDVFGECVDNTSIAEQDRRKYEAFFRSKNAQFLQQASQFTGVPYQEPEVTVNNLDELEEADEAGMFKLDYAIPAEQIIAHTYAISNWDTDLKYEVLDDFLDLGIAATKDYYDEVEKVWRVKYVDPTYLVSQYSRQSDYSDSDFQGHLEKIPASALALEGFTDEQIREVARNYCGQLGNPEAHLFDNYDIQNNSGTYGWYDFHILVMEAQWKDVETKLSLLKRNKHGHIKMEDVDYNYKVKKRDAEKGYEQIQPTSIRKTYKATWVVNSKLIYNHGCVNFMRRPNNKRTETDYNIRQITGVSLTKQLMPLLDQMQLLWLDHQNNIATVFNPILAVDFSMLENLKNGTNKIDPMSALAMARTIGVLPYKPSIKGNWQGGATVPIQYIQGGMGSRLQEFVQSMEYLEKMIADFTGLTPQAMGSSVDPNSPVGTSEMALAATSNVLRPYFEGVINLKQMSAKTLVRRAMLSITKDKETYNSYTKILGKKYTNLVKEAIQREVDIELTFEAKPDRIQRSKVEQALMIALENGRNKTDNGIDVPTYMKFQTELDSGVNLKKIVKKLQYSIKVYNANRERQNKENIMLQGQQNQQLKQQEGQNDMMKIQAEGKRDAMLNQQEADNNLKLKRYEKDPVYAARIDNLAKTNQSQMQNVQESQNPLMQQPQEQPL